MKSKLLILIISLSCLFVSCKKQEDELSNRENMQIFSDLESTLDYDKKLNNKVENIKKLGVNTSKIELPEESKSTTKQKKVKKIRKKLLSGITPISD